MEEVVSTIILTILSSIGIYKLLFGLYLHDHPSARRAYEKRKRKNDPDIWWEE